MLNNIKSKKQSGFTIIEVMIVLAIAALILLVVLLAVPALQRSSRNTSLKSDASSIAGGIGEFESNNGGGLPTNTGSLNVSGVASFGTTGQAIATAKVQGGDVITATSGASTGPALPLTAGTIYVVYQAACPNSTYTGASSLTTSVRSAAIIFPVETSGGTAPQCISS